MNNLAKSKVCAEVVIPGRRKDSKLKFKLGEKSMLDARRIKKLDWIYFDYRSDELDNGRGRADKV